MLEKVMELHFLLYAMMLMGGLGALGMLTTHLTYRRMIRKNTDVKLSAGYSTMLGTNTMKVVKGGNPSHWQDWGWLSININPTIFTTKW